MACNHATSGDYGSLEPASDHAIEQAWVARAGKEESADEEEKSKLLRSFLRGIVDQYSALTEEQRAALILTMQSSNPDKSGSMANQRISSSSEPQTNCEDEQASSVGQEAAAEQLLAKRDLSDSDGTCKRKNGAKKAGLNEGSTGTSEDERKPAAKPNRPETDPTSNSPTSKTTAIGNVKMRRQQPKIGQRKIQSLALSEKGMVASFSRGKRMRMGGLRSDASDERAANAGEGRADSEDPQLHEKRQRERLNGRRKRAKKVMVMYSLNEQHHRLTCSNHLLKKENDETREKIAAIRGFMKEKDQEEAHRALEQQHEQIGAALTTNPFVVSFVSGIASNALQQPGGRAAPYATVAQAPCAFAAQIMPANLFQQCQSHQLEQYQQRQPVAQQQQPVAQQQQHLQQPQQPLEAFCQFLAGGGLTKIVQQQQAMQMQQQQQQLAAFHLLVGLKHVLQHSSSVMALFTPPPAPNLAAQQSSPTILAPEAMTQVATNAVAGAMTQAASLLYLANHLAAITGAATSPQNVQQQPQLQLQQPTYTAILHQPPGLPHPPPPQQLSHMQLSQMQLSAQQHPHLL
jgi:hypothetical protein